MSQILLFADDIEFMAKMSLTPIVEEKTNLSNLILASIGKKSLWAISNLNSSLMSNI